MTTLTPSLGYVQIGELYTVNGNLCRVTALDPLKLELVRDPIHGIPVNRAQRRAMLARLRSKCE